SSSAVCDDAHPVTNAVRAGFPRASGEPNSPCVARDPLAGIAGGGAGELAFEAGGQRDAVAPAPLRRQRGERRVPRRDRARDSERTAAEILEGGGDVAIRI